MDPWSGRFRCADPNYLRDLPSAALHQLVEGCVGEMIRRSQESQVLLLHMRGVCGPDGTGDGNKGDGKGKGGTGKGKDKGEVKGEGKGEAGTSATSRREGKGKGAGVTGVMGPSGIWF